MKGRISQKSIDNLLTKVNIVDLISDATALKTRGQTYVGLCPLHDENTPSFSVNGEKGVYHCFGCGASGNAFTFMREYHQLDFVESVQVLAERYGVTIELEEPELQQAYEKSRNARRQLNDALGEAVLFYQGCLKNSPIASRYLSAERQIPDPIIERFQLGYAPGGWNTLSSHLARRGFSEGAMLNAGLVKKSERGGVYDLFRDRIIFPICDATGKAIALGGRTMGDEKPKYLNSPETEVFSKSKVLFGLHHAKRAIGKQDFAILCEGYMDVIALHSRGVENVAAVLGTAANRQHVETLARHSQSRRVVLNFDGDSAGVVAAKKTSDAIADSDLPVLILTLPDGRDPDSFLKECDLPLYQQLVSRAPFWVDWRLDLIAAGRTAGADYATIASSFLEFLATLPPILRSHYTRNCALRLADGNQEQATRIARAIAAELNKGAIALKGGGSLEPKLPEIAAPRAARSLAELALLQLYVNVPDIRGEVERAISYLNGLSLEPNAAIVHYWDLWKELRSAPDPQRLIQDRPELISQFLLLHEQTSDEAGRTRLRGATLTIEREIRKAYCHHLVQQAYQLQGDDLLRCQAELIEERRKIDALDRFRVQLV